MKYLITGASSGIGKRCAERLIEQGHECILVARNKIKLLELKKQFGGKCYISIKDISNLSNIEMLFDEIKELLPLDGLVHCAGVAPLKRIDENDLLTVEETYKVNVFSFIEIMRLLVKEHYLKEGASIVSMSSVVSQRGSNRQSIYAGIKAALEASTRCMAKELLSKKIRVNTIISGAVETEMLEKLRLESGNLEERMKAYYPLGVISMDCVCESIEFLLSEKSAHITGQSIPLDSGYLL